MYKPEVAYGIEGNLVDPQERNMSMLQSSPTEDVKEVPLKTASNKWQLDLQAYEHRGTLHLRWNHNAAEHPPHQVFRPRQGKICVYSKSTEHFPENPDSHHERWSWDDHKDGHRLAQWDTGLTSGSGYKCAWIAEDYDGRYRYLIQLTT
jgi:hypothetical protein